jgi:hypothetical protein
VAADGLELAPRTGRRSCSINDASMAVLPAPRRSTVDVSRIARIIFAVVLVVAALLNLREVASKVGSWAALDGSTLKLGLIAFEILLAVWLLWNVRARWANRAAICLTGVFAAISLYRLLRGERDCGCFGTAPVHPAWTLCLDVSLLLALCYGSVGHGAGAP